MNIQTLIWGLEELADKDLQRELWLGNAEGKMSSFVEAICATFDDSGLGTLLDSDTRSDEMSGELWMQSKRLDNLVRRIPQNLKPAEIVNHPLMDDVRSLAIEMLQEFSKSR